MRIRTANINRKKKCIEIKVGKNSYSFPFAKLPIKPKSGNTVTRVEIDPELAYQAVNFFLEDGSWETVHMDQFLEYNKDPKYMRDMLLFELTCRALDIIDGSGLSKNEIIRRLGTSPSQLYRLLDTTNYRKSVDEMLRLLAVLGCDVKLLVKRKVA